MSELAFIGTCASCNRNVIGLAGENLPTREVGMPVLTGGGGRVAGHAVQRVELCRPCDADVAKMLEARAALEKFTGQTRETD